jgi:cytochrome P450
MSHASPSLPPLLQNFSLDAPEFIENPYPFYEAMLTQAPVFYHEPSLCWFVSPYRLVKPLMRDERLSLDFRDWKFMPAMPVETDFDRMCKELLFGLDRKQHLRIRRLAIPAFAPKAVDAMRRNMYASIENHIAGLPNQFDFVTDIAEKLPLNIVMQWIGIAPEREAQFTPLSNKIRALYDPTYHVDANDIQRGIDAVLAEISDTRKRRRAGFIDTLVNHVDEGDSLNDWEILTLIASLMAAGPDTTADYVNFLVMELSKQPQATAAIKADPKRWLWPALEEASRVDFFGKAGAVRFAREDFEIEGHAIAKGDMLRLIAGAAYCDAGVFSNPRQFQLDRDLSPMLTFGYGAHFCIGAALARTISECIVQALFARWPAISAGKPSYSAHATTRHMVSLPMQG